MYVAVVLHIPAGAASGRVMEEVVLRLLVVVEVGHSNA